LYEKATNNGYAINLKIENGLVYSLSSITHSYEASILSDFFRNELIENGKKLTFETVMSHYSKIETLKKSEKLGYKNYLYFISTESVEINKFRVQERIKKGGHAVPINKIEVRYYKSLEYLKEAIQYTFRTFIFDNSESSSKLVLDIHCGKKVTMRQNKIPVWVDKYILQTSLYK